MIKKKNMFSYVNYFKYKSAKVEICLCSDIRIYFKTTLFYFETNVIKLKQQDKSKCLNLFIYLPLKENHASHSKCLNFFIYFLLKKNHVINSKVFYLKP